VWKIRSRPAQNGDLGSIGSGRVVSALTSSDLAADKFLIEGHTDAMGAAAANKVLPQQRADAVASLYGVHFGIAASRLQAVEVCEANLLSRTLYGRPWQYIRLRPPFCFSMTSATMFRRST
jgi:hypothetical protein